MKLVLLAFLSGILFGLGLALSQMTNPNKVIDFLDLAGNWDPSLLFVMVGALAVTGSRRFSTRNFTWLAYQALISRLLLALQFSVSVGGLPDTALGLP